MTNPDVEPAVETAERPKPLRRPKLPRPEVRGASDVAKAVQKRIAEDAKRRRKVALRAKRASDSSVHESKVPRMKRKQKTRSRNKAAARSRQRNR